MFVDAKTMEIMIKGACRDDCIATVMVVFHEWVDSIQQHHAESIKRLERQIKNLEQTRECL